MKIQPWFLYILKCSDNTLYTGITTNLKRRLKQHNNKSGARYTKGRTPVKLIYEEKFKTHSQALKREHEIKTLTHNQKLTLASPNPTQEKPTPTS